MWFKNLQAYRFSKPFEHNDQALNQMLGEQVFVPCGSQDFTRSGWVPPLGRFGTELVHTSNGYSMLCLKRQDRLLPPAVVNEALQEKLLTIEQSEQRKLPRKEQQTLKDEIIFSLLPKAFTRSTLQYGYISTRDKLLIVDAASAKRAEEFIDNLREALGSLSVIPLTGKNLPIDAMTQWLTNGSPPQGFNIGEECELRDNADMSRVIRCKNQDLATSEIVSHLKNMHVSKLAMGWQDRVEFLLDEKLIIKRLRFSDLVQEKANEVEAEDAATQFDMDFSIMTLELSAFFKALISAFGGEDSAEKPGE